MTGKKTFISFILKTYCKNVISTLNQIFTGRNEVLAKVIFSQASVIHSVHGGGGSDPVGGGGVPPNFQGGSSKFSGGVLQIFFWAGGRGGVLHRNTVNVRPVRILLECILVSLESFGNLIRLMSEIKTRSWRLKLCLCCDPINFILH